MKQDPLLEEKTFWADNIFKNLTGLTRSEDTSLNFYGMKLEDQKATEESFHKYAWLVADLFIEKWEQNKKNGKKLTDAEVDQLNKDCLKKAWEKYNDNKN